MEYIVKNEALTFLSKGQINSSNAEELEKEIDAIIEKESFKSIVFDMGGLDYISSAGLRIILKIKKEYDATSLIEVPSNIYDILVMVGFTNILDIKTK